MIDLYSVCGLWKLKNNLHWEFEMDNERGGSLIIIDENTRFSELVKVLLEDFAIDIEVQCLKLSYMLPAMSATIGSIPIFIRNDRQLEAFMHKFSTTGGVSHLCVTVEEICVTVEQDQTSSTPFDGNVTDVNGATRTQDQTSSTPFDGNVTDVNGATYIQDQTSSIPFDENVTDVNGATHTQDQTSSIPFDGNVTDVNGATHTQDQISSTSFFGNVTDVNGATHTQGQTIPNPYVKSVPLSYFSPNGSSGQFTATEGFGYAHNQRIRRNITTSVLGASDSSHSTGLIDVDSLFCGKLFKDKKEMTSQLRMYAVKHSFEFRTTKSDNQRYVLQCIDEKCGWRLRSTKVKASDSFVIRKYISQHSCDSCLRNVNYRQASAKTLGGMVSNHFEGGKLPLRPKQLMEIFTSDHGVGVSYSKAWRAQEYASELARALADDNFEVLPSWFHMVKFDLHFLYSCKSKDTQIW